MGAGSEPPVDSCVVEGMSGSWPWRALKGVLCRSSVQSRFNAGKEQARYVLAQTRAFAFSIKIISQLGECLAFILTGGSKDSHEAPFVLAHKNL